MSGVENIEVLSDDEDVRLDRWFKRHYPELTHGRLQKLLRTGQVRVDGKRTKGNVRLHSGQMVRVPPMGQVPQESRPAKPSVSREDIAFLKELILHMDDDVIALNKPPGLAVQGGTGIKKSLDGILDGLRFDKPDRPKLVHRLDKDTSGVLLLARSTSAASKLATAFRSKTARKAYWAIVVGIPNPLAGRIDLALAKMPGKGGERMVANREEGKSAVTFFQVHEKAGRKAAWVILEPQTGRTHQLRVHMAEIGTPIHGDGKYGGAEAFLQGHGLSRKLHLHARAIRIPHPQGGELEVVAPLPEHMLGTWRFLGLDESGDETLFIE